MESSDVIDDVNELLKLGVGDQYRLEHIKLAYIENKNIWESDKQYIQRMKEKYLVNLGDAEPIIETTQDADETKIHCWKCGDKSTIRANFCMKCGAALFDVGEKNPASANLDIPHVEHKKRSGRGPKILVLVGIPILLLIIAGAGYTQGYFDRTLERSAPADIASPTLPDDVPEETHSKCGPGTKFEPATNSCVLR